MNRRSFFRVSGSVVSLFVLVAGPCAGQQMSDGTFVSSQRALPPTTSASLRATIEPYVQQTIYTTLLKKAEEYVRFAITQQKMELFPQIAYGSMNQVVLQSFEQESLQKYIRTASQKSIDEALARYENKENAASIESAVTRIVADELKPLFEDMVFTRVVEQVLQQAAVEQRKIIVMTLVERQAQLAAIQRRYAMAQQLMQQRYAQIMNEYLKQSASQRKK